MQYVRTTPELPLAVTLSTGSAGTLTVTASVQFTSFTSSSISTVTASVANATLVAANPSRNRLYLSLSGSATAYIRLGSAAATTSAGGYNFIMQPGDFYSETYNGAVTTIFTSGSSGTILTATQMF